MRLESSHRPPFTLIRDRLFQIFSSVCAGRRERIGRELLFSWRTSSVLLSYGSLKAIIIRQLSRIESISPVWNIVTEVRIRVGEDTADVLCFRKFCYRSRWLMWPGPPVGRTTGRYVLLLHLASKYNQVKYECRASTSTCLGRMRDKPARWCTM